MSENERDREIAAAWRDASRDEPPPAVDDAIRAQARRAVGASPEGRRRHRQWRYPAATAALVAVLAFGIARITSREQVEPLIVADQAVRQPPVAAPAEPREQNAPTASAPAPGAANEAPRAPQVAADSKVASAPPDAPAARESSAPRTKSELSRKENAAAGERFAAPPPPSTSTRDQGASAARDSPARETASDATARQSTPDATPGGAAPDATAREPRRDAASRDVFAQAREPEAPAASKPQRPAVAAAPMAVAKVTNVDETKAKQAGAESVEAWIARIRDLKSRGESDAAAKELAKFRETYGDRAEALLPAELRNVAPSRP